MPNNIFLSLGSNLGDREKNICRAVNYIKDMEGFELQDSSSIYVTDPVDMEPETPSFLNMVIKGKFKYTPNELLTNIEKIEELLGRETDEKGRKKARPIDIDILFWGDGRIDTDRLTVPHPEITKRVFVLIPLNDIDPELVHPVTGKRIDSYIKKDDRSRLILYKELEAEDVHTKLHCH